MKKNLLIKSMFLLFALIVGSGTMWAEETVFYTLDGTVTTGGNSNYAQDGGGLTQNGISWSVTANTTMNPWRIGGKNLTNEDRIAYSKTAMGSAITKIELELGDINLTLHSISLIVASDASFDTELASITKTGISANTTLTFSPASPATEWATNAYYKFIFNVSAGGSNSYVQLKSAKFYTSSSTVDPNTPGTENHPYTVAEARAAIDANSGTQSVYATGIVSAIPNSYSSSNGITFNMVDNSGDTNFLQAYKCKGTDAANVQVGDVVVVKGNLKKYNSIYEFDQNCTLVSLTHQPSILATPTQLAVPNYKYGTAEPTYKTLTVSGTSLKANITLSLGESSNFEISADKENWSNTLTLSQSNGSVADKEVAVRLKAGLAEGSYEGTITLTSTDATNVTVNLTGSVTSATTDDGIYAKYTSVITEGYYVITYGDNALKNTISSNRFSNGNYEATNNIITNPDPSVIWHIQPNGDYWTIYNDDKSKYAAGSDKNKGALIDDVTDFAKWTITVNNGAFEFENLGRSKATSDSNNKWLRNNGNSGWACYATGTGGALTLYKLTTLTERVITFDGNGGSYNEATTHTQNVYDGVEATLDANQFTREGYVFAGWNTVRNGENGTAYTDQDTITVTGDNLTLYAQWSPLYSLTIDNDIVGGSVAIEDGVTSAVEGTEITLSFTQTTGHAFDAWDVYKYGDESTKVTVSGNKFTMPAYNVVVSASFREVQTYSLVTNASTISSGKHYVIASGTNGSVMAMGQQNDNNRAGVAVNASNGIIPEAAGVYKFAIYGPDANGYYSIYDETSGKEGYLYAASSNSNYLKTQNAYNSNGVWEISFNADGVATMKAKGTNTRNWMRFNSNNSVFSCYGPSSQLNDVYLFEKDGEENPTANVTFASSGYASYCSPLALNLTPAEDYAAYAVTATSGTSVTFTKITGAVLPKTPFILYGKSMSGQTVNLPIANGETTDVEDNKLVGTLTPTAITTVEGVYTNFGLSGGEFKKIASGTIPANKAYLPVLTSSLSSEARLSIVLNDGTTGVNDVRGNVKEISDSIFDLQGRKVSKPTKGLYIMNGKKVFVK